MSCVCACSVGFSLERIKYVEENCTESLQLQHLKADRSGEEGLRLCIVAWSCAFAFAGVERQWKRSVGMHR